MARKPAKKPALRVVEADLYAVKLLRNYMPMDNSGKVFKGGELMLPLAEAERVIDLGIGVRNDPYTPGN